MAQLEPWTNVVSDHVMDAQVIARRAVVEDGVVTPTEQAMLDSLVQAQEAITDVHDEIVRTTGAMRLVASVLDSGRVPGVHRTLLATLEDDGDEAA